MAEGLSAASRALGPERLDHRRLTDDELRWELFESGMRGGRLAYKLAAEEWDRRLRAQGWPGLNWVPWDPWEHDDNDVEEDVMADSPGYGFLYPTPKDTRTDTSPILSGSVVPLDGGEPLRLVAWKRKSKDGTVYLSLKIQPPEDVPGVDASDDIPF